MAHRTVRVPLGKPSSVALPFKDTEFGRTTGESAPALTAGGWFCVAGGVIAMIVVVAVLVYCALLALNCKKYVPGALNVALVVGCVTLPNVTVPGPPKTLQRLVSVVPAGDPLLLTEPASVAAFGNTTV